MHRIEAWSRDRATHHLDQLIALLQDAVEDGASVGFLPPLTEDEARSYWLKVLDSGRPLLVACDRDQLLGAVQLDPAAMPNGSHRAEVMKLLVHSSARRRGIGRALMEAVEDAARKAGRTLLVLDTRLGDASEQLYRALGYQEAGRIPRYARSADGSLHTTVFFCKQL